jgi:hypothetical protein
MSGGRPSIFTQDIADRICSELAEGKSLRQILKAEDLPGQTTVFRWLAEKPEFEKQYAHAREAQAEKLADEIIDIADDGTNDYGFKESEDTDGEGAKPVFLPEQVQRSKLRVDARKWVASKLHPKKYGDYQRIDAQVSVSIADRLKEARERAKRR